MDTGTYYYSLECRGNKYKWLPINKYIIKDSFIQIIFPTKTKAINYIKDFIGFACELFSDVSEVKLIYNDKEVSNIKMMNELIK